MKTLIPRVFTLKPTEKAYFLLQNGIRDFQSSLPFQRSACFFMWQSNVFNTLTLKQIFWKTITFFKKHEYCFLVETIKIENTSFPFKTALSEDNVKTNRMAATKWTYHKEWSFASNYFIYLENLFQFSNLLKRVNLMYQQPKSPYSYFLQALEFSFRVLFPYESP